MFPFVFAQLLLANPEPVLVAEELVVQLNIEDCSVIERERVASLLSSEFRVADPGSDAPGAISVQVNCSDPLSTLRVVDSTAQRSTERRLDLRASSPLATDAKTRELALLVGELVRSLRAPASIPAGPDVQPKPPLESGPQHPEETEPAPMVWLLSMGITGEQYSRGYLQYGPVLALHGLFVGRWVAEFRAAAKFSGDLQSAHGTISSRAWSLGVSAGSELLSYASRAGVSLVGQLEVNRVLVSAQPSGSAEPLGGEALAWSAGVAPGVWISISEHFRVVLEPRVLLPLRGVTIRDVQDTGEEVSALRGVGVSATLGLAGVL